MKKLLLLLFVLMAFASCQKDDIVKPNIQTLIAPVFYYTGTNAIIKTASADYGTVNGKPMVIAVFTAQGTTENIKTVELMVQNTSIYVCKAVLPGSNYLYDSSNVLKKYWLKISFKDGTTAQGKEF